MGGLTLGYGDNLMATGMARGAACRGKRIAFGNGRRLHGEREIRQHIKFTGTLEHRPQRDTSNSTESIDTDGDCHF